MIAHCELDEARVIRVVQSESGGEDSAFIRVHASREYPEYATIAIPFRDHWFYIDSRDTRSKRGFALMRTLIGIRLTDAKTPGGAPTLTIPVSR